MSADYYWFDIFLQQALSEKYIKDLYYDKELFETVKLSCTELGILNFEID